MFRVSREEMAALAARIDEPKVIALDDVRDELRLSIKTEKTIEALCEQIKLENYQ